MGSAARSPLAVVAIDAQNQVAEFVTAARISAVEIVAAGRFVVVVAFVDSDH